MAAQAMRRKSGVSIPPLFPCLMPHGVAATLRVLIGRTDRKINGHFGVKKDLERANGIGIKALIGIMMGKSNSSSEYLVNREMVEIVVCDAVPVSTDLHYD